MNFEQLKRAEKRENTLILLALGLFLLLSLALVVLFYRKSIVLVSVVLIVIILGMKWFWNRLKVYFQDELPLANLLEKEPRRIVWVYSMITQRMPFGFQINQSGTMYFKLIDGDELSVSLPAKDLKIISEALNTYLPHATFGYTKEREQWFLAHPAMLLKDE